MIREILTKTLPQAYGLQRENVSLETKTFTGDAVLNDRCSTCATKKKHPCNEQNMLFNAGKSVVTLLMHEEYINQFNGTQLGSGRKCDFILLDDSENKYKIAFCDLTCSLARNVEPDREREKLPEGKRAKVIIQLQGSVHRLTSKEETKSYLESFQHRHCIFGWRDPFDTNVTITPQRGDVEANMLFLSIATSGLEPVLLHQESIDGVDFVFYQVKYPAVYNW